MFTTTNSLISTPGFEESKVKAAFVAAQGLDERVKEGFVISLILLALSVILILLASSKAVLEI